MLCNQHVFTRRPTAHCTGICWRDVHVSHFRGRWHPRLAQWRPFWRTSSIDHRRRCSWS